MALFASSTKKVSALQPPGAARHGNPWDFLKAPALASFRDPGAAMRPMSLRGSQSPLATRWPLQAALEVGAPDDPLEQEAERVADSVVRHPGAASSTVPVTGSAHGEDMVHRACVACEAAASHRDEDDEGRTKVMRAAASAPRFGAALARARVGGGEVLPPAVRAFMEPRFGRDFGGVKVHRDAQANSLAESVHAKAFTVGGDLFFRAGQFDGASLSGRRLIAHELTHVVQQASGKDSPGAAIRRSQLFSSTLEICHRVLRSRVFHVSQGGIRVTATAAYEMRGATECRDTDYHMTLSRQGLIFDSEYGTCGFPQHAPLTRQWTGLPEGDYYLTIFTNNTNPNCCLTGDILVDERSGLQGESCTRPPPGPLEILHTALDLAGLIPALGVIPDVVNAGIYLIQGDWINAGISAAAMIPILGAGAIVERMGARTVVRVSGETVERLGRNRIAAGLREARAARRGAVEGAEELAEEGVRRRVFAKRNPPVADPTLPPGTGHTDKFGNITYSSAGSATDQALVRFHEQVHSVLSPRLNLLRTFRADLAMTAYQRSSLLRYLEEALAESYAQLRVNGIRSLPNGLRFPIQNGYVTLRAVVTEAAIGTVLFGALTYGVYLWVDEPEHQPSPSP